MLRVLHVVAPAPVGGLESVVRLLAAGHRERGHDVRVAAVVSHAHALNHPFVAALEVDGIPVEIIRTHGRGYRVEREAVAALCRDFRPHVVHTHGFRPDVVDGVVARREGVATVSTVHSFIGRGWRGRLYEAIQRRALRRYDAVVGVSRPICERLQRAGVASARVHLLPNAFRGSARTITREDARARLGIDVHARVIGWVGRLSEEKGPDVMLDAFARVSHRDAVLVMIGDGRDGDGLRDRARALGIDDRIVWAGRVPNAAQLLSAIDVFVLSSRTEGTPIALLEAMAASLPIVTTRVGGVPDVVDEHSARLVASLDVVAIAEAVDGFLDDDAGAAAAGSAARERVQSQFAIEPWLEAYERIYHSVAALERSSAPNALSGPRAAAHVRP